MPDASELTDQQRAIIETEGSIKVEALAGTGKTTTLGHYAAERTGRQLLYLVFNRAAKEEAERKAHFSRVTVSTFHGFAFRRTRSHFRERRLASRFRIGELSAWLSLGTSRADRLLAKAVHDLFELYCRSADTSVEDAFPKLIAHLGPSSLARFVAQNKQQVIDAAKRVFNAMADGTIEAITHDYYLKVFSLESGPSAFDEYDIILADEAQDQSEVLSALLRHSQADTVFVGDSHQQIYGWRYAVNTLAQLTGLPEYRLTRSFRFGPAIANAVNELVRKFLHKAPGLEGCPRRSSVNLYEGKTPPLRRGWTYISRTIAPLLELTADCIANNWRPYVEGGIATFRFPRLYDLLSLMRKETPCDSFLQRFQDLADYTEYCEEIDDRSELALIGIVKRWKNDLHRLEENLRSALVQDREAADIAFTTAHRAKGLEFDKVCLCDTFCTEFRDAVEPVNMDWWRNREEVNLLYVALTRACRGLLLPKPLSEMDPLPRAPAKSSRTRVKSPAGPWVLKLPEKDIQRGKVTVEVRDRGDLLAQPPLVQLPDGRWGVCWQDGVYPLRRDPGGTFYLRHADRIKDPGVSGLCAEIMSSSTKGRKNHGRSAPAARRRTAYCYNCGAFVASEMGVCPDCGWIRCLECGACGCGYEGW